MYEFMNKNKQYTKKKFWFWCFISRLENEWAVTRGHFVAYPIELTNQIFKINEGQSFIFALCVYFFPDLHWFTSKRVSFGFILSN